MNNKLSRDDLHLVNSQLDELNYTIQNLLDKETVSGFKIMLIKLKSDIHKNRLIMNKSLEAYDLLERKGKENEKE